MDWRDVGKAIHKKLEAVVTPSPVYPSFYAAIFRDDGPPDLYQAIWALAWDHDTEPMIDLLLSERPLILQQDRRKHLAKILKHRAWEPRPGRRIKSRERFVSLDALSFYKTWKQTNKELGISDWGVRDTMKDESCNYAIALFCARSPQLPEPNFETVRQLMDRPASRRGVKKSRQKGSPNSA